MRILIAGCGRLGSAAGCKLAAAGHQVYGLRRNAAELPAPIVPISADLLDSQLAARIPVGIAAVVYALTPAERTEAAYRRSYVDGLQALLDVPVLADQQIHWLFVSSTAVYADAQGGMVSERTPATSSRFNGRVLIAAEALLTAARARVCLLRLGGIYGPGRRYLIDQLQAGRLRVERQLPHYSNRIHSEDAARLIAQLVETGGSGIINGVDTYSAPDAEVADWLAARLNLPLAAARSADDPSRDNKAIASERLHALPFYHRYPDYRAGYSTLLATASEDSNDR